MANARGFLKIDGVLGDSTGPAHPGSFVLLAWGWGWKNSGSTSASVGSDTSGPNMLHITMELNSAAQLLFLADAKGTVFKTAHFEIDYLAVRTLQVDFKGVTISGSGFNTTAERPTYGATIHFEALKPIPVGPPAQNVRPEHAILVNEALHGRSRPGRT